MSFIIDVYNLIRNADQIGDIVKQNNPRNSYERLFQITQLAVATLDIIRSFVDPIWERRVFHAHLIGLYVAHLLAGALLWRDNDRKVQCQVLKGYISMFSISLSDYSSFSIPIIQYVIGAADAAIRGHSFYEHCR